MERRGIDSMQIDYTLSLNGYKIPLKSKGVHFIKAKTTQASGIKYA